MAPAHEGVPDICPQEPQVLQKTTIEDT